MNESNNDSDKVTEAVECFNNGFNCAQAILSTYCGDFGLDKETALKTACGLGAGMGRLQETCGAVTGAFLVIGLKYGKYLEGDEPAKEKTYTKVQEFARLFALKNNTTNCREILGVDFLNGDKQTASERVKSICPKMIRDTAEILGQILADDEGR